MSLFGGLYVGTSGLQTSQNALNTVAHNMVNVDTKGYTRQQTSLATRSYNTISKTGSSVSYQQVGLGVSYADVKQVRDYFLDKSFRKESGRSGFYDTSCDAIEEVEEIFQELDGEAFAKTLDNLWVSVQELAKDPSSTVNQGIFIQRCSEFVTRSSAVYQNLCDYQDDLNYKVKQKTDAINSIGKNIVDLNEKILKIESGKVEQANDLRDDRNRLIDELSEYASISVDTDIDGNFIVQIEGVDFITVGSYKSIGLYQDQATGFYYPYWEQLVEKDANGNPERLSALGSAGVFNIFTPETASAKDVMEISTELNTDIGSLKSSLVARGDKRATAEDLGFYETGGSEAQAEKYSMIKDSVVMNVMAEFDKLIHDVTTGINDVIADAANAVDPASTPNGYLRDSNGDPYKIFTVASEKYPAGTDYHKNYTTLNILINDELKQAPSMLGFIRKDGIVDQTCADNLKKVFTDEVHTLNPEVKTATNLNNYYNNLISQVANTGYIMRGISANQEITVTNIASSREEILGVSTDEELSNMIMFQNAFNASSRYVNAMSQMIEHLIMTLGS